MYIVNGKNYLVSGNYFYDSNVTAISIGAIQNVTISNNYIYKTTQAGASGISITSTAKNATVYGNTILYTKGTGITTSSPSFVINSNTILGAGSYGIYVNGGGNGTISGNRVNQAVTIAVYINNAWNVMVIGNVLHSSNTGVKTFGASNWNYISYNNFRGCVVATNLIGANDTAAYNTGV